MKSRLAIYQCLSFILIISLNSHYEVDGKGFDANGEKKNDGKRKSN